MKVKLGKRYRDRVTGFEGVATSLHDYLQGCRRVTLEQLGKDGDKIVTLTFDEPNLELVDQGVRVPVGAGRTGGPHDHSTPGGR
jgi:hypothetical protein